VVGRTRRNRMSFSPRVHPSTVFKKNLGCGHGAVKYWHTLLGSFSTSCPQTASRLRCQAAPTPSATVSPGIKSYLCLTTGRYLLRGSDANNQESHSPSPTSETNPSLQRFLLCASCEGMSHGFRVWQSPTDRKICCRLLLLSRRREPPLRARRRSPTWVGSAPSGLPLN
jgi:hypothetical protein